MSNQQPFPSLIIRQKSLVPQGSFAEAQAQFLSPDSKSVGDLDRLLERHNVECAALDGGVDAQHTVGNAGDFF